MNTIELLAQAVEDCSVFTVNDGYICSRQITRAAGPSGPYFLFEYSHPDNLEGRLLLLEDEIAKGRFTDDGTFHCGFWQIRFYELEQLKLEDFQ